MWVAFFYFGKYFMSILSYHWPGASENLLHQGNFLLCATRSSFPRSLPLLSFPLINACTGFDVRDSATVEQQPCSRPEEDVGVASLWKAEILNGTQGRFSAAAGGEARFSSVFAVMTAHITLRVCVHMRPAMPDPVPATHVTLRLTYSEAWLSIFGHSITPP